MKKIKQVFAFCGAEGYVIDQPLNAFIMTLPRQGAEITKITYVMNHYKEAGVRAAIVEYENGNDFSCNPTETDVKKVRTTSVKNRKDYVEKVEE